MVRIKSRWLTVQLDKMYNISTNRDQGIRHAILEKVQELHGDYGLALMKSGFQLKYYNPHTHIFVMRVLREHVNILETAIFHITSIDGQPLTASIVNKTGSVRSVIKFLTRYHKQELLKKMKIMSAEPARQEIQTALITVMNKPHDESILYFKDWVPLSTRS